MKKYLEKLRGNRALLIIHLSFLLILTGALCTYFFGQKGMLKLYPDEKISEFRDADGRLHSLPVVMELDSFRVEYYEESQFQRDYVSYLKIDGEPRVISMNRILTTDGYRFCQAGYDYDGSTILTVNHDPWGITLVYTGYLAFAISGLFLLLSYRGRWNYLLRGIAMTLAAAMTMVAYLIESGFIGGPLQPVLNSPWLSFHVSLAMASYALFGLTFAAAVVAFIKPSTGTRMRDISLAVLHPAEWLLGLGIITGSVWANSSWGSYWSWDPKETLALITFLIYAIPLHRNIKSLLAPRNFHIYMFFGIFAVAATYFGVNLLPSLHSYG